MSLTIQDIAKLSDTSKSTVSRYLNGGSVSLKTAERIKRAIDETGFEMNIAASRLKTKKAISLAYCLKVLVHPAFQK